MGYNELTNSRAKSRPITLFLFQGDVSSEFQIENMLKGVTVIPGTTEFGYATTKVTKDFGGGQIQPENWLSNKTESDMVVAIEQLLERAPNLEHVSLVVAWHGTDLRIGECEIKPKVERPDKDTTPRVWQVAGVTRATAEVVSSVDGYPAAGGAPADWSIYEAVVFLKSKGLRVTLYPFILMDIPADNTLPNPYSDDAAETGQPAFPWRGRITVSPAAGFVGTVDKTATAATQVSAFFGTADTTDFSFNGTTKVVTYTGPDEWTFRRFILHMATIGAAAGADDFLIGTELVGMTTIRSDATTYPGVTALKTLANDVRSILGSGVRISYAADWSEYHSHRPGDGSNDVFFHLDPLWADSNIDFIGIDNYFPISDWRDGETHLDFFDGWRSIYDLGYLESRIEGGEAFDWYYASSEDRDAQVRTPIEDLSGVTRDVAIPREIAGPAIIGPTGLLTNSFHEVLGRDGYFHPDSGTSEGQFVMIYACARAAKALETANPTAAESYSRRSRLMATTLEETFYRRALTGNEDAMFVPHWLNAARGDIELQTVELHLRVSFVPVSGGRLKGTIPVSAGGDVVLEVYSVRAEEASLLWENPYSPVIGEQLTLSEDPVVTPTGTDVYIWGTEAKDCRVAFSFNRGELLPAGQPYEAWPIWRRLEPGEVACAGDAMRWAILAYDAMDEVHGGSVWSSLSNVTKENTVRAFDVDDGRWMIRPGRAVDPTASAGVYQYAERQTNWVRDVSGGLRAVVTGPGESQIGRGFEIPIEATDTISVKVGSTVATDQVSIFIDTAASYSEATRYRAVLDLPAGPAQEVELPLSAFLRLSDDTPLSGAFTARGFGLSDKEPQTHAIVLISARPTDSVPVAFAPYITPFTINILNGDIIDWRGVPGSGYQCPDLWVEIGGAEGPAGMETHAQFLTDAQDAWSDDVGFDGPFAHAYVWDRFDSENFGQPAGTWIYDWHDPNSRWGGYQYRPLEATARAILKTEGDGDYADGRALCIPIVSKFISWLNTTGWTSASSGPPTDYPPTGPETLYDEPHFAAIILRACMFSLQSATYRADAGREAAALALAARAWAYISGRFVETGQFAGTWSGGWPEWFGFWQAEIIDTMAELMEAPTIAAEIGVDLADVEHMLVLSDQWLEGASASVLGEEAGESWVFRQKDIRSWWQRPHHNRPGGTRDELPTDWSPQSKPVVFTELGCPAVDKGPNQPNVFVDPKSSESFTPFFSDGLRDELAQRAFLEAWHKYWQGDNNPKSSLYGGPMLDMDSLAVWTWDSRPFPAFPQRADFWSDSVNWQLGHWINGRLQRTGEPVGRISSFAYTDSARPFTFKGVTYQPVPISCGTINASGKLDKSTFEVRLPRTAGIADLFRAYPPSQPVTLIVRQGHINDADQEFLVAWAGRVLSSKREGNEVIFACEPTSSSLRRPGLRRSYQFGCPHALYGPGCHAPKQPQTGVVSAINSLDVTLAPGWNGPFAAVKFAQGLMEWDTPEGTREIRRILRINGNTVTISGMLRGLAVSDSVTMLLGCAHTTADCLDLHNNIHNFGGCPTIPLKNPLSPGANNFY